MVEAPGTGETFESLGDKLEEARRVAFDIDEANPAASQAHVEQAIALVDSVLATSNREIKDAGDRASLQRHAEDIRRIIALSQDEMQSWKDDQ